MVAPEVVFKTLKSIYGEALDKAEFHPARELPLEERVAHQFAFLHRTAQVPVVELAPGMAPLEAPEAKPTPPEVTETPVGNTDEK